MSHVCQRHRTKYIGARNQTSFGSVSFGDDDAGHSGAYRPGHCGQDAAHRAQSAVQTEFTKMNHIAAVLWVNLPGASENRNGNR